MFFHTAKTAEELPKGREKELSALTWPQNSGGPNLIEHLWKLIWTHGGPIMDHTWILHV